jgi:hypothetical protein
LSFGAGLCDHDPHRGGLFSSRFWRILPLQLIESIIVCPMVASVFNCCDRHGDRSHAWFANRPTKLMAKLQCRLIGTFPWRNIGCTLGQYRWSRMGIRMASNQSPVFGDVLRDDPAPSTGVN